VGFVDRKFDVHCHLAFESASPPQRKFYPTKRVDRGDKRRISRFRRVKSPCGTRVHF
jgi:predicted ATPase